MVQTENQAAAVGSNGTDILEVRNLQMYFPVTSGIIIQRKVADIKAVDGVTFSIKKGETLGLVDEEEGRRIPDVMSAISDTSIISYTDRQVVQVIDTMHYKARHTLVLAGDYICAILRNNLVVFEALQDD